MEITLYDGDSYFSIYRREIDVRYIKEMCEEIKGIADKFNQSFLTEDEIIKLIGVSITIAGKLNIVNGQLANIKQLSKELTN